MAFSWLIHVDDPSSTWGLDQPPASSTPPVEPSGPRLRPLPRDVGQREAHPLGLTYHPEVTNEKKRPRLVVVLWCMYIGDEVNTQFLSPPGFLTIYVSFFEECNHILKASGYPSSTFFHQISWICDWPRREGPKWWLKMVMHPLAQSEQNQPKNKSSGFILKDDCFYLEIILYNPQVLFGKMFLFKDVRSGKLT